MTVPDADRSAPALDVRASRAAASVQAVFGTRLAGLPGTHLAVIAHPAPPLLKSSWHYWWQAHYLDALVDAGRRELAAGDAQAARATVARAEALVRTVRLRNAMRFHNDYYDDMAWLALAGFRLHELRQILDIHEPGSLRTMGHVLRARLESAHTGDMGGGLYWSTARDFKNVPATGPAALFFARVGDLDRARELVDWLYQRLFDPAQGLFLDGLKAGPGGELTLESAVYSYNQGTVLGALLAIGDRPSLARAADLIASVQRSMVEPNGLLHTHGVGDGGLFTGILVRYLSVAAADARVDAQARERAAEMVLRVADAWWSGRDERVVAGAGGDAVRMTVFSTDPGVPAAQSLPPGSRVDLSTQLQGWMALESAVRASGRYDL